MRAAQPPAASSMSSDLLQSMLAASGDALPFAAMDMEEARPRRGKKRLPRGTVRQRSESRLAPPRRTMTDPLRQYEIIPNGNPRFLTKASQQKILEVSCWV